MIVDGFDRFLHRRYVSVPLVVASTFFLSGSISSWCTGDGVASKPVEQCPPGDKQFITAYSCEDQCTSATVGAAYSKGQLTEHKVVVQAPWIVCLPTGMNAYLTPS